MDRARQKLVLNLRDPARVTTVIPSAKVVNFQGHDIVVVPHRIDETRVLRNLGFQAPSPIAAYYDWPGQYKPFEAQRETAAFLTLHPHAFVLNSMGTGKTMSVLWAFHYMRSIGLANKMLVVSPLSTLERTWADEVFRHFPELTVSVLYGSRDRRLKMLAQDADIYLINHDGMKTIEAELIARTDIDTVTVDEVASFRNAQTARWKTLSHICAGRARVWGLTGTPTPNSPADAWAQCRLISPQRVPKYFRLFKEAVMKQVSQFKWLPRDTAPDVVAEAMQPSIRYSMEDCVDLPECIYTDREVPMTQEQKKAYATMKAKLLMEFEEQQVKAVNEAVKMQKLVQIACGVVYGRDGEDVILPNSHRIETVIETIEEAGTKVIVFVPYKGVLRHVAAQLREHFKDECAAAEHQGVDYIAELSGETSKNQRDEIFSAFQSGKTMKVLVAQPAAMSHGLTLTAASTIIWYAPVTSNEVYSQANARITRPGQKHTQLIVNVSASDVERRIYEKLKTKQSLQGLLLDLVRNGP